MKQSSIHDFFHASSAPCCQHPPMMHDVLDDRASWGTRLGLRFHLLLCGPCRKLMHQLRFVSKAAQRADQELVRRATIIQNMPGDVRDRIVQRVRDHSA